MKIWKWDSSPREGRRKKTGIKGDYPGGDRGGGLSEPRLLPIWPASPPSPFRHQPQPRTVQCIDQDGGIVRYFICGSRLACLYHVFSTLSDISLYLFSLNEKMTLKTFFRMTDYINGEDNFLNGVIKNSKRGVNGLNLHVVTPRVKSHIRQSP